MLDALVTDAEAVLGADHPEARAAREAQQATAGARVDATTAGSGNAAESNSR
jgi:hypothetical protein